MDIKKNVHKKAYRLFTLLTFFTASSASDPLESSIAPPSMFCASPEGLSASPN